MKKSRQLISMILCVFTFVALLSGTSLTSYAATTSGGIVATISSTSGKVGDEVTVNVSLPANSNMAGGSFNLVYDSSKLSVVSATAGNLITSSFNSVNTTYATNKIRVTWAGSTAITSSGNLLTVKFKLNSTGTASLSLENFKLADADAVAIECSAGTGTITISSTTTTTYTITYNANGGNGAPASQTKTKDVTLTLSSTKPTRIGYVFNGWKCSYCGSIHNASSSYTHNASSTLTAQWTAITYTVKYNANGGSGSTASSTHTYDTSKALTANGFSRSGYTFLGWSTSSTATSATYSNQQSVENLTSINNGTVNLYAVWGTGTTVIESGSCGTNLTWTLKNTGVLEINGNGYMDGYALTSEAPWYEYRDKIKTLHIDSGVLSIGHWAFYDCDNLTDISITIPYDVTSIGSYAFYDCDSLTSITNLLVGVSSIDACAFQSCDALTSVSIPTSMTSLSGYTFRDCGKLKQFSVSDDNQYYSADNGVLFNKDKTRLICLPSGKTGAYTIPDGVKIIGHSAIYYNNGLTSVSIPDSVTTIEENVFRKCNALLNISVDSNNTNYSSVNGVLFNKDKTVLLCCPTGKSGEYTIPVGVESIDSYAFAYCKNLTNIVIPNGVKTIADDVFYDCDNLQSIALPKTLKSIGNSAFMYCTIIPNVYYAGTQEEWNSISVGSGNTSLTNGTIHYQSDGKTYTITYNYSYNGGTSATKTTASVTSGSQVDLTPTATKSGWTFVGWNTEPSATTGLSSHTATNNITLYAIYKKTLTASFYYGNNNLQTTKTVTIYNNATSGSITVPSLSIYSGWNTVGWRDDTTASSKEYSNSASVSISADKKFYGVYSRTTTLSYNANGGSGAPSNQTVTQYYNAYGNMQNVNLTISSTKPTRSGYTFLGWSTSSSATSATYSAGGSYTSSSSATLYAVWQKNEVTTYTITYNANGGSGTPASQTKTHGVTLTLSSTKPTRSGYTFLGWSTSSSATSATYSAGGSYTNNSSATLYAVWQKNEVTTYTITYNANGGSGAPASQTKTKDVTLTLSSTKPTRSGYTFLGWSTSSSATSATYSAGGSYTSNSSATLYAVWKQNPAPTTDAKIKISSARGTAGKEVTVTVALENNPGIISMLLNLSYDKNNLTLTNVDDSGILGTTVHGNNLSSVPYVLCWANDTASSNYVVNGTIVTLTFKIKDTAPEGAYPITITYDNSNDEILNLDFESVDFEVINGEIEVCDYVPGDVTGDGKVTATDRITLARYLSKWDGYDASSLDLNAADVNGDGKVTATDRIIIARYLSKWDGYDELPHIDD